MGRRERRGRENEERNDDGKEGHVGERPCEKMMMGRRDMWGPFVEERMERRAREKRGEP